MPPGNSDARMGKGGAHYMDRRSAVRRMRCMGVPEPVRRHLAPDACSPGRVV